MEWLCERQCILCVKSFIVRLHWQQRQKTTIDPHSAPPGWKWPLRGGGQSWHFRLIWSVPSLSMNWECARQRAREVSLTFVTLWPLSSQTEPDISYFMPTLLTQSWLRFRENKYFAIYWSYYVENLWFLSYRNVFGFKCESIVCVKTLFIICWCDSVTCWLSFPFPCLLVKAKAAVSCFCPEHTRPNMRKLSLLQRQQKSGFTVLHQRKQSQFR